MKALLNNIQTIIIIVLVVFLILQRSCSTPFSPEPKIITKVEIQYDTVEIEKIVYVPKWSERIVTKNIHHYYTDTIVKFITEEDEIDTAAILKDYFAKYYYEDTIELDTFGNLVIYDSLTQNKIFSRSIASNVVIPTKTITHEIYKNKLEFYAGAGIGVSPKSFNYLGGEMLLKTKKSQIYSLGVGFDEHLEPVITVRTYWKIGRR